MTALSAALGYATTVISRIYTFYSSVVLFFAFGVKMLKEGYEMSPTHGQVRFRPREPHSGGTVTTICWRYTLKTCGRAERCAWDPVLLASPDMMS